MFAELVGKFTYSTESLLDFPTVGDWVFDKCMSFDSWPYSGTKVIVLTTKELILPEELTNDVEVKNCSPHDVVSYVYDSGIKHIYVDGGLTIQSFFRCGYGRPVDYHDHPGFTW